VRYKIILPVNCSFPLLIGVKSKEHEKNMDIWSHIFEVNKALHMTCTKTLILRKLKGCIFKVTHEYSFYVFMAALDHNLQDNTKIENALSFFS
jgi:hypothetical protein